MTGTATVTAKTGPNSAVVAKTFTNVYGFFVDLENSVLHLKLQNNDPTGPSQEFDLANVVTFTISIAGSVYTLTVSTS